METQLRLSLTLSGGASLGAYQSGAASALLVAAQHMIERGDDRIRVEALGGASAGALVALFSAHALLAGVDPVALLRTLWVEKVSLDLLRSRHGRAPLDFEDMRDGLRDVLGLGDAEPEHPRSRPPNPNPLALHVSLTGLRGLTYPIRARDRDRSVPAVTYADWGRFLLAPDDVPEALFEPEGASPLEFVLASAANPGGFAPRRLDRSDDADRYRAHGIDDLPDHGVLWYSDGGLIQSEPLGRVMRAGRALDREWDDPSGEPDGSGDSPGTETTTERVRRVNVVIDPRSEGPSGSDRWADPDDVPRWEEGLSRALAILPAQILYDDLRRTEKRNTRLEWADALVDRLRPLLGEEAEPALDELLAEIDDERESLRSGQVGGTPADRERDPDDPDRLRRKLRRAVEEVAGLVGKERVAVDVISPRLLTERTGEEVPALLAGEFLGDFGGFLRYELRHSDFCLGFESGQLWMERALPEAGLDDRTVTEILERVEAASPGDWRDANRGGAELPGLPWRARARLARYVLHMGRVVAGSLMP